MDQVAQAKVTMSGTMNGTANAAENGKAAERAFSVEVIGFNATERIVLGSIFNLSARRTPRYQQHHGGSDAGSTRPDLILVDASDPQFVEQAKRLHATHNVPVTMVGDQDHATGWPLIGRPLQWARLFKACDTAVGVDVATRPMRTGSTTGRIVIGGALPQGSGMRTTASDPGQTHLASIPGAPWILVVDDSAPVREFMHKLLVPMGLNVDTAESGEIAIGKTANREYACIFLDVMLPGVDGYQVCKLIKSKPTGKRSPVIMLTSKSSPFDRIRGTMSGCDSYLIKPVDEAKLCQVLGKILAAHGHGLPVTARA